MKTIMNNIPYELAVIWYLNLLGVITFWSFFSGISIFFALLLSISRLKRDIDKYHDGSIEKWFKSLIKFKK